MAEVGTVLVLLNSSPLNKVAWRPDASAQGKPSPYSVGQGGLVLCRDVSVERKTATTAFDGGRITSDGGVMLLAAAEKALGIGNRSSKMG